MDRSGPGSLTRSGFELAEVVDAVKPEDGRSNSRSYSLKYIVHCHIPVSIKIFLA